MRSPRRMPRCPIRRHHPRRRTDRAPRRRTPPAGPSRRRTSRPRARSRISTASTGCGSSASPCCSSTTPRPPRTWSRRRSPGLHRHWSRLRDEHAALGYLRTAVVNGSRSVLRRRRTAREYTPPHTADARSAESLAMLSTEHQAVVSALGKLPRRQREVLVLRYYGGPVRGRDRRGHRHQQGHREVDGEPRPGGHRQARGRRLGRRLGRSGPLGRAWVASGGAATIGRDGRRAAAVGGPARARRGRGLVPGQWPGRPEPGCPRPVGHPVRLVPPA